MAQPAAREPEEGRGTPPSQTEADSASSAPSGLASIQRVAMETRRYRGEEEARPTRLRIRSLRAYWTTWRVIWSYLWLKFRARFHSDAWISHNLRQVNLRNARRIERTIVDLRGLFIKVGQLISIMTNFLPEEFRRELEGLQDAVPPRPYVDIEARIVEELDKRPDELFAHFEKKPIASASIGQVHIAKLHDGSKVAVKVQYPDIEETVRRDLNTL